MPTARSSTVLATVAPDFSRIGGGGVREVNKFEQISGIGHQMSLAGRSKAEGSLHSKFPCPRGVGVGGIGGLGG